MHQQSVSFIVHARLLPVNAKLLIAFGTFSNNVGLNISLGTICHGQTDPWQVVPRQVFTPHDILLILVAFVVLCGVGCFWVTSENNKCYKKISAVIWHLDAQRDRFLFSFFPKKTISKTNTCIDLFHETPPTIMMNMTVLMKREVNLNKLYFK